MTARNAQHLREAGAAFAPRTVKRGRRSNGDDRSRATNEEALDLSPLTCWVGFMLRVVQVRVFQRYYEAAIGREISPGALSTLTAIVANPGVRPGTLADALVVRRPNMTKLIDSLVRAGLVRKRDDSGDRRSVALFVTAKGGKLIERTFGMSKAHDERTTMTLSDAERAELLRLLGKLATDLIGGPTWVKAGRDRVQSAAVQARRSPVLVKRERRRDRRGAAPLASAR